MFFLNFFKANCYQYAEFPKNIILDITPPQSPVCIQPAAQTVIPETSLKMCTKGRRCNMCSVDGLTLCSNFSVESLFYELPLCREKTGNFVFKIMKRHEIGERAETMGTLEGNTERRLGARCRLVALITDNCQIQTMPCELG